MASKAGNTYFSANYFQSREQFVEGCVQTNIQRYSTTIDAPSPAVEPLTIEFGVAGHQQPTRAIVVSSGVHGVETPLGSAVQLALINELGSQLKLSDDTALVLIHAVNPYGAAWNRRFNEHNVDLNRNFMRPGEQYAGAPLLAYRFRKLLGPRSKPGRISASLLRMGYLAALHGQRSFWETLPVGQYEFPDWLFYGGSELASSGKVLGHELPQILCTAQRVLHIDFHTGLGRWAECELLLSEGEAEPELEWWRQNFSEWKVAESASSGRYVVRGGFGPWLQHLLPDCEYHYVTAEFGTYSARRVLTALAEENRWTRLHPDLPPTHWSRRRLAEAFAPRSKAWRNSTFDCGLRLVHKALEV